MRGALDLALNDLNRALALIPDRPNYLVARGDVFNAKGDLTGPSPTMTAR